MAVARTARFQAELLERHKGVTAVLVPFDPEAVWKQRPVRLAGRRHGWLVRGMVNGVRFDGYIGERWNQFFLALDEALRDAARISAGDRVTVVIAPSATRRAYDAACRQSEATTQPGTLRPDVVELAPRKARTSPKPGRRVGRRS